MLAGVEPHYDLDEVVEEMRQRRFDRVGWTPKKPRQIEMIAIEVRNFIVRGVYEDEYRSYREVLESRGAYVSYRFNGQEKFDRQHQLIKDLHTWAALILS